MGFLSEIDKPLDQIKYTFFRRLITIILSIPVLITLIITGVLMTFYESFYSFWKEWIKKCW